MSGVICIEHISHDREQIKWSELPLDMRHGLYIVQSTKRHDLFRIGAGGVGASETSTLRMRTKAHTEGKASDNNPTTQFKLWSIIWIAIFPSCDKQTTLLAEVALIAKYAHIYAFVHESIFYVTRGDDDIERVIEVANKCKPSLEEIIKFQTTTRSSLPKD